MAPTPTQALATIKLGRDVSQWACERRTSSMPEPSFQAIADDLLSLTGVRVTDQTIRLWCRQAERDRCPNHPYPTWHADGACPTEAVAS